MHACTAPQARPSSSPPVSVVSVESVVSVVSVVSLESLESVESVPESLLLEPDSLLLVESVAVSLAVSPTSSSPSLVPPRQPQSIEVNESERTRKFVQRIMAISSGRSKGISAPPAMVMNSSRSGQFARQGLKRGQAAPVMSPRWIIPTLALTFVAGVAAIVPTVYARQSVETPRYTVESEHAGFELRRYEPRIVAEVVVEGTGTEATNAGFRILADFIFGNNTAKAEVAMTAPVDRSAAEAIAMTAPVDRSAKGDKWVVAFTMPTKYTLETLPKPNDKRVTIREVPSKTYAVSRFSGAPRESVVQQKIADLIEAVDEAGLQRSGAEPTYARYDPPWTLGFMRRNEIFIELTSDE